MILKRIGDISFKYPDIQECELHEKTGMTRMAWLGTMNYTPRGGRDGGGWGVWEQASRVREEGIFRGRGHGLGRRLLQRAHGPGPPKVPPAVMAMCAAALQVVGHRPLTRQPRHTIRVACRPCFAGGYRRGHAWGRAVRCWACRRLGAGPGAEREKFVRRGRAVRCWASAGVIEALRQ